MHVPRRTPSVEGAVELLMAWLATPDGPPDLVVEVLTRRIENHPSGDPVVAAVELIMGMTHVCGSVLSLRQLETDIPAERTIQDLALHLADMDDF